MYSEGIADRFGCGIRDGSKDKSRMTPGRVVILSWGIMFLGKDCILVAY